MTGKNYNVATADGQQNIADSVVAEFKSLEKNQGYKVPDGYNVSNALQAAVLKIGGSYELSSANPDSIKKALFNMLVQGLNVGKDQLYFIKYGQNLEMQRSYFGTQTVLKRLPEIKDIVAYIVHDGDDFEIGFDENGMLTVLKHQTQFKNLDNEIIGAYAIIIKADGQKQYEVMTKKQIDTSWSQTKSKNSAVQKKFPEEMAKRTVINRAAKNIINTATSSDKLIEVINDTTQNEYDNDPVDVTDSDSSSANKVKNLLADAKKTKKSETVAKKSEVTEKDDSYVKENQAKNREALESIRSKQSNGEVLDAKDTPSEKDMKDVSLFENTDDLKSDDGFKPADSEAF